MPTWTLRLATWYLPDPTAATETVASQTIRVSFECCCCEELDNREPPEIELTQPVASIHEVQVDKQADDHQFGDRTNILPPIVRVRKTNCAEGPGVIVWVDLHGQFNRNPNPPPYEWGEWRMSGAWRICCCCDPITGKTDWCAAQHRRIRGGVSEEWMYLVVTADEKPTCDDEVQAKRTTIRFGG